ncbi:pirin family protein [Rhodoferax sp.]|uniref:pirin family protein n=1 Tax=Rhodoferax sp. TaxID=50421 RepID=UPI00374D36BA
MIEHRPYHALGGSDSGWLKARLHIAFSGMGNPIHGPIGALRVWNDDEFAPQSGFPMHRHQDVDILTYVRRGAITHEDSLGNKHTIQAGDVQAMRAGSGISHSEFNAGDEPTWLYQIWLEPRKRGAAPSWQTRHFPRHERDAGLVVLASGHPDDEGAMPIDADARLLAATLRKGKHLSYRLAPGRAMYIVTTSAAVEANGLILQTRDGLLVHDEDTVTITAHDDTEIVIIETHQ